jgi:hypothetical protein
MGTGTARSPGRGVPWAAAKSEREPSTTAVDRRSDKTRQEHLPADASVHCSGLAGFSLIT